MDGDGDGKKEGRRERERERNTVGGHPDRERGEKAREGRARGGEVADRSLRAWPR